MHEMERQKLAHHHARRLRALGAKPDEVEAIVRRLLSPASTAEETQSSVVIEEAYVAEEAQVAVTRKQPRACPPEGPARYAAANWVSGSGKRGNRFRLSKTNQGTSP